MDRRDFMQIFKAVGSMAVVSHVSKIPGIAKSSDDTHKYGVNIPFSSFYNSESNHLLLGYFLAAKHINEGGPFLGSKYFSSLDGKGILGKKIQLILKDSIGSSRVAQANAKELFANHGVVMVSGGTSSAEVLVNRLVAAEHGRLCMDGISHSLSCSQDRNGFSLNFDNDYSSDLIASQLPEGVRFIQVYNNYDWSQNQMAAFSKRLSSTGGIEVARHLVDDPNVDDGISALAEQRADVLVVNLYGQKLVSFLKQLALDRSRLDRLSENGSRIVVPLMSQLIEKSFDFSQIPGLLSCKFWDAEYPRDEVASVFVKDFQKNYGVKPSEAADISYFQTLNFSNAAQAVSSFDRVKVSHFLKTSAHSRFRYQEKSHRSFDSGIIVQSVRGQTLLDKKLA